MLIVFSGLPGTGKMTLARLIAGQRRATYLRIDSIEQAIRASEALAGDVGPSGYLVGYALAEANLALGQDVVADTRSTLSASRGKLGGRRPLTPPLLASRSRSSAPIPPSTAAGWKRAKPMSRGCSFQAGKLCSGAIMKRGTDRGWWWTRLAEPLRM